MTLTLCWINKSGDSDQLCIASDSRLRSAGDANECQKIFPLGNGRLCAAFCGDTHLAFPLIHVLESSMRNSFKFWDGSQDIFEEKDHFFKIINAFNRNRSSILDEVKLKECQDTKLVLCAHSWFYHRFVVFKIAYNKGTETFELGNMRGKTIRGKKGYGTSVVAIGDEDARAAFFRKLGRSRNGPLGNDPVFLLQEVLDSDAVSNVGGVVQVVRMFKSGTTLPTAIRKGGDIFLFGRKLLAHEKTTYPILDLKSRDLSYPLEGIKV
jgi:hypothetical protein